MFRRGEAEPNGLRVDVRTFGIRKLQFCIDFLKIAIDFFVKGVDYLIRPCANRANRPERRPEMDINTRFIEDHSRYFIESRRESCRPYRYGNGSPAASMIATAAAGVRRAAATVERWARGTNVTVAEYRLPRANSAR